MASESLKLLNLKLAFKDTIDAFAQDVAMQIEKAYEDVIDQFYADYDPRWYDRTYSTYLASSGYKGLFDDWGYHDGYRAGIVVDSSNIPGEPYRANKINERGESVGKDWVFTRTFEKGIHGINRIDMGKHPLRWKDIRQRQSRFREYSKIWKNAGGKALAGIQTTGAFSLLNDMNESVNEYKGIIGYSGRYNLNSPSPKKNMDKRFNNIKKKSNLDALAEKHLDVMFSKMK